MVNFHLPGIKLFKPYIFLNPGMDETDGLFPFYFHRCLSLFPVVEPGLRPPADSCPVGIDGDDSRNVEALDVDVQFLQRVDDTVTGYGFVMKFFFTSPPIVERYTSWRRAR